VVAYKAVVDPETGRPKGHAFCEFANAETAESAINNLNGHNFHGRELRVAKSSNVVDDSSSGATAATRNSAIGALANSTMTPAQITSVIQQLTPQQQVDIMAELKALAQQNPTATQQLLADSPQLATALLQLQIMYGFLTPQHVKQWQAAGQQQQQQQAAAPAQRPAGAPAPAPGAVPAPPPMMSARPGAPMPPAPPQYPPQQPQQQHPPHIQATINALAGMPEAQRANMRRLLQLSPEQLSALPGGEQLRTQVQMLQRLVEQGVQLPL
jgi:cleavage stimulation factor subunit 2